MKKVTSIVIGAGLRGGHVYSQYAPVSYTHLALDEDVYGYIAGQGSSYIVNTVMASTDEGKKMLESELTEDTINSEEFAAAFKTAANLDQANGSEHTTDDNGNLMAEFNTNGKACLLYTSRCV